ncbi:hypothetical protein KW798_01875 [Candidatus Parcubacteria bacterium]|nr:hypothetical protein [Candidatus Parcubacteria bacterium]
MKTFSRILATSMLLLVAAPALALGTSVGAGASVQTTGAASTSVKVNANASLITKAIQKADQEIDRRIQSLQKLVTRVGSMAKVTDEFKANLNTNVQNQIGGLTQLKTKIDADTDETTLKGDVKTIKDAYRVYVLLIPQAVLAATADRIVVLVDMMVGMGNKLSARIDAAAQAGADVTALKAALADLGTQLTQAQAKAQSAVNGSAGLSPDQGDVKVTASNAAALKVARTDVQAAHDALVKARQDIQTILQGLKNPAKVQATSSSQVQVQ